MRLRYLQRWEVSISEEDSDVGKVFVVARELPELALSESRAFETKRHALRQFYRWLE